MDKRQLDNDVTTAIINCLHYLQNYENLHNVNSVSGMNFIVDGGKHRFMNDAKFHAQCEMMRSKIMSAIYKNIDD